MLAHLGVTNLKKNDSNLIRLSAWTLVSNTNGEEMESMTVLGYMWPC